MKSTIQTIQQKEIGILKEFIRVCEKHGLTYYALGGTLLGAVRHQGFIPWDDDIDLGMPRKDYEAFMRLPASEFQAPYQLVNEYNTPGFTKAFMNLQDKSTKIVMTYSKEEDEQALWIDIFPIDGLPKSPIKKFVHEKHYLLARMMVQLSQFDKIVNQNKTDRPFIERAIIKFANLTKIEKWLSYEKCQRHYIKTISKYDMSEAFAGNYAGAYKLRELVPSDYFGQGDELVFDAITIHVPSKYKEYLSAIYGEDYMQLPPEDKRTPHQYRIVSLGD